MVIADHRVKINNVSRDLYVVPERVGAAPAQCPHCRAEWPMWHVTDAVGRCACLLCGEDWERGWTVAGSA